MPKCGKNRGKTRCKGFLVDDVKGKSLRVGVGRSVFRQKLTCKKRAKRDSIPRFLLGEGNTNADFDFSILLKTALLYDKMIIGDDMENKERKSPRLKGYDYSKQGVYFVTFCTFERRLLFWESPFHEELKENEEYLNFAGKIADEVIRSMPEKFPVRIDKYVVMPNHVHMLIMIPKQSSRKGCDAELCRVVGYIKRKITIALRKKSVDDIIWQRSFHDHIIRNEKDYQRIWKYIENNPLKWSEDCFYKKRENE